jgi:UDP-N-acetyl-alpha-D-muramoyl-L-alanyl-L-glutamate epimerase
MSRNALAHPSVADRPLPVPARPGRFALTGFRAQGHGVRFGFKDSQFGRFEEQVDWPVALTARSEGLLGLLHIALGVSYYKTQAAGEIVIGAGVGPAASRFARALYGEGLGEFFIRNGLDYPPQQVWPDLPQIDMKPPSAGAKVVLNRGDGLLCAFGGGKDSHVAARLLTKAGYQPRFVSVSLSDLTAGRLAAMTDQPILAIKRRLDPRLSVVGGQGALNGHVPITAINALMTAVLAVEMGLPAVAFANERSAEEATMMVGDLPVNHQYSKSGAFEALLQAAIDESRCKISVFSALRPVSELWIARALSKDEAALEQFASCNRNFVFLGPNALPEGEKWCRACAKCVFTGLILAPFLDRSRHGAIFGGDLLDNPANLDLAEKATGLQDVKPWDCVGETAETSGAIYLASQTRDWSTTHLIADLAPRLIARHGAECLQQWADEAMALASQVRLPEALYRVLEEER